MKKKYKLKKKYLIVLSILVFSILVNVIYSFLFVYHIKLNGNKNEYINVNSDYKDKGLRVIYRGKKNNNYKIDNRVDTHTIGEYDVIYEVNGKKIKRHVNVIDKEKPSIVLEGETTYKINYKGEFVDPGYKASDNYDGDITSKVSVEGNVDTSKIGEYFIKYTVKDNYGNKTSIDRKVIVSDIEAPKIEFTNNINRYAILNKEIKLDDFKATDNYDGDITSKVKYDITNVNFNKKGIYEVEYSIKDSNANETIVKRTINVQNKNKNGIPVLMYHWFYDDTKNEKLKNINVHNYVSKTNLEKQLKFLKESKYYFPTWDELIKYIDGKIDLPQKSVIITDDDCVNSFFKVALPLFQKYEIPVTSFCITNKNNWQKYKGKEYLDFESHTDSLHVRMCKNTKWDGAVMCKDYNTINKDIKTSVEKIGNTNVFAYPFGHYNDDTIKALKNNNFKLAFTINEGRVKKGYNKFKLPRVRISKGTTLEEYKEKLK